MKNGVHLQGFKGYFEGTKAIDIKVGDVLVWNYGLLSKVISKEISPSGKSVYLIHSHLLEQFMVMLNTICYVEIDITSILY